MLVARSREVMRVAVQVGVSFRTVARPPPAAGYQRLACRLTEGLFQRGGTPGASALNGLTRKTLG